MVCFCHVTGRKCWKLGAVGSVFIYSSEVSKNKAGVFLLPGRPAVFSLTVSEPGYRELAASGREDSTFAS